MTTWNTHTDDNDAISIIRIIALLSRLYHPPTIKHSPAELGGGGQREAGVVELVAVVTDADLELDGVVDVLQERGRVKRHEEGELPLPEKLLLDGENRLRKRNRWMIFLFYVCVFVCVFVCASSSLSPPPPAGRPMGCLQFSAPACPPVW